MLKTILLFFLLVVFGGNLIAACTTPATVTVLKTETGCNGNEGKFEITATGGTQPYKYSLDSGTTFVDTSIFYNLSNGIYHLMVMTSDSCYTTLTDTLSYIPMNFKGTEVSPTCFDFDAGMVTFEPKNGNPGFEYSSDNGANYSTFNIFQTLTKGNHTFRIKDSQGCEKDTTIAIGISHIGPSVATEGKKCGGALGKAIVSFLGTDGYFFSIDNNKTTQSSTPGTSYTYSLLQPGQYTLQAKDNFSGCVESVDFTIEDETINASIDNVIHETCNDTNATFTINASNGAGPLSYSIDGGLSWTTNNVFTNLDQGIYFIKIIDTVACETGDTLEITNTGGVTAIASQDTAICSNDQAFIYVTATGIGLTYIWDNLLPAKDQHIINPSSTTTYNVTVSDTYNCTKERAINVKVNPYPNISVSTNKVELCKNDSIKIVVSGAETYLWNNGLTDSVIVVNTSFAFDTLIVYGFNGVCESRVKIPSSVHSIIATISDTQQICTGNSAQIIVNSITNVTYKWNNNLTGLAQHTVFPTTTTEYSVIMEDAYGCKDSLKTTVKVDLKPTLTVLPTKIDTCEGQLVTLTASGADNYLWSNGDSTNQSILIASNNETLTLTGYNGVCSKKISIPVTVKPSPLMTIGANTTVSDTGQAVQFDILDSRASSFIWNFGDGKTSSFSKPLHTFSTIGIYVVTLTGTLGQCSDTDTLHVYVGNVGINEPTKEMFSIFPNPVIDVLSVNNMTNQSVRFLLYTVKGELVMERMLFTSSTNIGLSELNNGLYFCVLKSDHQEITKKIIKVAR